MPPIVKPVNERLYLSKVDKQVVYVDCQHVLQHQLDGIRFLYKTFKKSLPGVVLNDPSGYGKTLQIVLFIKSIHHVLERPVVILSNECEIGNWREHFEKFTDLADDIIIESTNPFSKKMIFINTLNTSQTICRGNWSIMVIDNEEVVPSMFKRLKIDYYRIWVTSMDMKENLTVFWPIYNWLYPNENLSIEEFTITKNNTPRSVICKSIKLDRLLEDIVIRRNDWEGPLFQKSQVYQQKSIETVPTATKKNKDSTGTKIKRSKRKLDDNPSTSNELNNEQSDTIKVPKTLVPVVMESIENENATINDNSSKMHLFDFIDNTHITSPSKNTDLNIALNPDMNKNKVIHSNSDNEEMKVDENESMSVNCEILVSDTHVARDVIKEINGMEVDGVEEIPLSNLNENISSKNVVSSDVDAKNDNVNITTKNKVIREDVVQNHLKSIGNDNLICSTLINDTAEDEMKANKTIETSVSDTDENNMCGVSEVLSKDDKNSEVQNDVIRDDNKQNESMSPGDYNSVRHTSIGKMDSDVKVNGIKEPFVSVTEEHNFSENSVSVVNDINDEVGGISVVKVVGKNIDDQIRDLEEKYMKKFKGSFLDSLFK